MLTHLDKTTDIKEHNQEIYTIYSLVIKTDNDVVIHLLEVEELLGVLYTMYVNSQEVIHRAEVNPSINTILLKMFNLTQFDIKEELKKIKLQNKKK